MKLIARCSFFICFSLIAADAAAGQHLSTERVRSEFASIPLYFEPNLGQSSGEVRFLAKSDNLPAFIDRQGLTILAGNDVLKMRLIGGAGNSSVGAEGQIDGVSNYYLGSRSITGVPHYKAVRIHDVVQGVDLVYHGAGRDLEYDLVLQPNANPELLRFRFDGTAPPRIEPNGDLVFRLHDGEIRQRKPRVWQDNASARQEISCRYVLESNGDVALALARYSHARPLVIDPVLSYSTFIGGTNGDAAQSIAVDASGFAYVAGYTRSPDFPVTNGTFHQPSSSPDVFVAKFNPSGSGILYSTIIGGSSYDAASSIAINAGSAYIGGSTMSTDFPVTVGTNHRGAFVAKLDTNGVLAYSNVLGSSTTSGNGVAVDSSGMAYLVGTTTAPLPVTPGALLTTLGAGTDGFLAKFNSGGQVAYATYLGGNANDTANAVAVNAAGNAFVAGTTASTNFPFTPGSYSNVVRGNWNAFVVELNPTGSALVYSTVIGGTASDTPSSLALDATGNAYIVGTTYDTDYPVTGSAFQRTKPSNAFEPSGFLTKLDATGSHLIYSTYLGGSYIDNANGVAVDAAGLAYVTGSSNSIDFPTTPGALKTVMLNQSQDTNPFLAVFSADGAALEYSTLLGSTSLQFGNAVALDGNGGVYLAGTTLNRNFPVTPGAYQTQDAANSQLAFVSKIDMSSASSCNPVVSPSTISIPGHGGSFSFTLTLAAGCPWEATLDTTVAAFTTVTFTTPSRGVASSSPITISGTIPVNNSTVNSVNATVHLGTASVVLNQAPASCLDPLLTPASAAYSSSGGSRNVTLAISPSCSWTAAASAPWIVPTPSSGQGSAVISVYASSNNYSARSGSLSISGGSFAITQSAGTCTATANATPTTFAGVGGTGVARITPNLTSCAWAAYSTVPWIHISTSAATGQGYGLVPYVVDANLGTSPRSGQLLIADQAMTISQAAGPAGTVTSYVSSIFAGAGPLPPGTPVGDGGPATSGALFQPQGLAFDPITNTLYIADSYNNRIRMVTPDGLINTAAGGGSLLAEGAGALSTLVRWPLDVAVDKTGAVYFNENQTRIRKLSGGTITTVVGGSNVGFSGDNGPATNATVSNPRGMVFDANNNLYFADSANNRIRKISNGTITTVAGGATGSALGDGGPATNAMLANPTGLAMDSSGNLYISDVYNARIREVHLQAGVSYGVITTAAGGGSGGDGSPATSASLILPSGVGVDVLGNLFTGDNSRLRWISTDGIIQTVWSGIGKVGGVAVDPTGNVYFTDLYNYQVVKLTPNLATCSYSVTPLPPQSGAGGIVSVLVTTASGCAWSASSDVAWAVVSTGSGIGTGMATFALAANPSSSNSRNGVLSVAGQLITLSQTVPPSPLGFFPLSPCRAVDTRASQGKTGPLGSPYIPAYAGRDLPLLTSNCGLPNTAQVYSTNITAVPAGPLDFLSAWPTGQPYPGVSTLNSTDGGVIANAAVLPAGTGGSVTILAGKPTDLIIDVNGYFAPPNGSELVFYPVTPCRIADTRDGQNKTGAFGPPSLGAYSGRDFPIAGTCGVPTTAQAFALNLTAVPKTHLDFLSMWPSGQLYPGVSTLNSPAGAVIANAAIVPVGAHGAVTIVAGNPSDLIIDVNGYFAPPAAGALHFYPLTPCQVADTRLGQGKTGAFGPPSLMPYAGRDFAIQASACSVPASAQAYSLNFTAVPQGPLDFLSVWPTGQLYPGVSTLNSPGGNVVANAAIVPAGTGGSITVVSGNATDVIIDINGYFAP